MKGFFIAAAATALILFCLFGSRVMGYAAEGYKLFITSVFPALFPFLVLVSFMNSLADTDRRSKPNVLTLFIMFAAAALSGSPSGSLLVESAFGSGDSVDGHDASTSMLSAPLNLCCPLFIIGSVSGSMLRLGKNAAYLLLISHYGSALLLAVPVGLILIRRRNSEDSRQAVNVKPNRAERSISDAFASSVYFAMQTMLRVCGTLVFFMVIVRMIESSGALAFLQPAVRSSLLGVIEMTSGIKLLSSLAVSPSIKLCLIAFLLSFSGISVMMQVCSAVKTDPIIYSAVKLTQGIIAALICFLFYPLLPVSEAVFSEFGNEVVPRLYTFSQLIFVFALSVSCSLLLTVALLKRTRT